MHQHEEHVFGDFTRLCLYYTGYSLEALPRYSVGVHLGPDIELVGYHLLEQADIIHPGDVLCLSLIWEAADTPREDYTVFVQLLDEQGRLQAQLDRCPADGFRPTSSWQAGERIRDNYGLQIPPDLLPGRYQLIAGMYLLATMERLPVMER